VLWFVISEAKGDEECNSSDTDVYNDDLDIWIKDGPAVMLTECILMAFTFCLFAVVYCKRGEDSEQLTNTAEFGQVGMQSNSPSMVKHN
jgi:hypothetical protein